MEKKQHHVSRVTSTSTSTRELVSVRKERRERNESSTHMSDEASTSKEPPVEPVDGLCGAVEVDKLDVDLALRLLLDLDVGDGTVFGFALGLDVLGEVGVPVAFGFPGVCRTPERRGMDAEEKPRKG
jgi:hypothetical protein